ncbi:MAG: hypothetical protein AD742_09980 [Methylibium sp. NZG]|nr:MAG: hypothetical protein AD742_09980 [Methylibium sp. NZG]
MHLLIPFASALSEPAAEVLRDLPLPALAGLLQRLTVDEAEPEDDGDEYTLSPPHERALARAWGWPLIDGGLPFAAQAAAADGIEVGTRAWGLLTPTHWDVGRDHVTLTDPEALQLVEGESRALFDAVRHLFESEGFALAWGAPSRWYASHESLSGHRSASLARVVGRNVDLWLRGAAQAGESVQASTKLLRRLQSEVQLLLYPHPVNEAREERGAMTVNSFWLSGCGRHQAADRAAVQIADSLRGPPLQQDWAAWAEAWRALDAGALSTLLANVERGDDVTLTLCGERRARSFGHRPQSLLKRLRQRWSAPLPAVVLEAL